MKLFLVASCLIFLSLNVFAEPQKSLAKWNEEQQKIIEVNRFVPLALKQAGFKAYAKLFHPDYTNWYMAGDQKQLLNREEFLANVKKWFDAGNYANYSKVVPISIEVFGDIAYVRHLQEEHFVTPDGQKLKFVGHFASLMKKYHGKWTFFRTSFQERYRGPLTGSEISIDEYD